ncbi:nuclear transport factor 2 family protein [Flammeovirga sp. SJP92]|uniref:nuclear transport factor 2 family protein n=1 Tax=Flammeovirga sp. SJP92 TaxID=1775430 RepID=UPI0020A5B41E|nr:nuclear transport factor 2 family protein [Flammeovirga sp. SJP92]
MKGKTIMEVTTFNIKSDASPTTFAALDAKVESDFTSKQKGFITRQSGVDDKGDYVVVVYWKSVADADASMSKFMGNTSVADYTQMIDAPTMKMSRYAIDKPFNAENSRFVEIMSFDVKEGTDVAQFQSVNQKVETDFTRKQKGFLQRLIGVNESGEQVVAVYWENKALSDASLQPFMEAPISKDFMSRMDQNSIDMGRYKFLNMDSPNKEKVVALLNSFNTGDQTPISYINPEKYIQHNLDVGDGLAGFGAVMKNAPEGGFKANVVRVFQDGDYVFTHTEYDFFGPKAAFDVFRFEDGKIVEHWDNLAAVTPPNPSGRTQFDGTTDITDREKTNANKKVVWQFVDEVLLNGKMDNLTTLVNPTKYLQHNSAVADGLDGLGAALKYFAENDMVMVYDKVHKVLAEGNFVLTMSEGKFGKAPGNHVAYYDLFRLENGQIVEHWDVIQPIPPKSEWKNDNGKF